MEVWKGKRWGIAAILHTKIDQHDKVSPLYTLYYEYIARPVMVI